MKGNGMPFFSLKRVICGIAASICISFTLTIFVMGCSSEKRAVAVPRIPVTAAEAVKKTVPVQIEAIGSVEAYQSISIKITDQCIVNRSIF